MKQINDETLRAHLSLDENERVRQINYVEKPWESKQQSPVMTAIDYLRQMGDIIGVSEADLNNSLEKVSFVNPREQGLEYRFGGEKQQFDSSTIIFNETYLNVPVWRAAITFTIKNPNRVLSVIDTSRQGIDAQLPSSEKIEEHRKIFASAAADQTLRRLGLENQINFSSENEDILESATAPFIRGILALNESGMMSGAEDDFDDLAQALRGRFFVYCYDESKRFPLVERENILPESTDEIVTPINEIESNENPPTLSLPPVDSSIADGAWRVVSEVTFQLKTSMLGTLNWRALVDVETDSVLFLEPLVAGNFGFVFHRDPITSSGILTHTPSSNNQTLNPLRTAVKLPNLEAPVAGKQKLRGRFVVVSNVTLPNIAPPTVVTGSRFDYGVRTDDFAAVNAYYHSDSFFTLVENLGFSINSYFDHTTFPVPIDHRDNVNGNGNAINARCVGNGTGGIGFAGYCLNDLSDINNPLGRACDSRVHLHELGGHGILYEHVDSPNFGFAHSAGDSLSAILHDPESKLRNDPDLRFKYAPWHPTLNRHFNRKVTDGWAWGGRFDDKRYKSEQILCTTLFRIYRAIGGDSDDLEQRQFASRMVIYLILRTISTLTPATNPSNVLEFVNALMSVDLLSWTTEGMFGGAYNKVIRWSFEKQGLFQPDGAMTPVRRVGNPPIIDVFINDERNGEYQYQPVYSNNSSIWNRRDADEGIEHQVPISGTTNFAYVKIKNRGTEIAQNVVVRGFHHKFGGSTVFPTDFQPLDTAELTVGTLDAYEQEEKIVGPFAWVPIEDALGHDSLMMVVTANGDPSNIDNFTSGESIAEWRLIPNDNNIGLRNVFPILSDDLLTLENETTISDLFAEEDDKPALNRDSFLELSEAEEKLSNDESIPVNAKWGITRHAAIAAVAWKKISEKTKNEISRIFENSNLSVDLGEAARWADKLKTSNRPNDPATVRFLSEHHNRRHNTWHYVNLPLELKGYDRQKYPQFTRSDDILQMILLCVESLRNPGPLARFEEINALRWLTHLIGDLHQPIHIGCGYIANARTNQAHLVYDPVETVGLESDRGGGLLILPIGGNLHSFWDSKLGPDIIHNALNSESERLLVNALFEASANEEFQKISDFPANITEWANESLIAARSAYDDLQIISYNPSGGKDFYKVKWKSEVSYRKRCASIVSERMTDASYNLAALLESIWD